MANLSVHQKFSKKTLLIIASILSIVGIVIVWQIFAAGEGRIYLNNTTVTVGQNEEFTQELRADSGTEQVAYVLANLSYPNDKLELLSVDYAGGAYQEELNSSNGNGNISISRGIVPGQAAVSGDQLVAKLRFKIRAGAVGMAPINLDPSSLLLATSTNTSILPIGTSATLLSTITINAPSQPNAVLSLSPQTQVKRVGETAIYEVRLNTNGQQVSAAEFSLSYDSSRLTLVNPATPIDVAGGQLPQLLKNKEDSIGIVSFAAGINPQQFVSGDLLIGKISFTPKTGSSGTAQINFSGSLKVLDNQINNILGSSTNANLEINGGFSNNPPPIAEITSPQNNSVATAPSSFSISAQVSAVALNATLTKAEFLQNQDILSQCTITNPQANISCAVNDLPAGSYSYTVRVTDSNNSVTTSPAIIVIVESVVIVPTAILSLQPPTQRVNDGNEFNLSLYVNSGTEQILGVDTALSYDSSKIEYLQFDDTQSAFKTPLELSPIPGIVRVARGVMPNQPISGNLLIGKFVFKAKSNVTGSTDVVFSGQPKVIRYDEFSTNIYQSATNASVGIDVAPQPPSTVVPPTAVIIPKPAVKGSGTPRPRGSTSATTAPTASIPDSGPTSTTYDFGETSGGDKVVVIKVLDKNGNPVVDETVEFAGGSALTNNDGEVTFRNVKDGQYEVKVKGRSSVDPSEITIEAGENQETQNFTVTVGAESTSFNIKWILLILILILVIGGGFGIIAKLRNRRHLDNAPSAKDTSGSSVSKASVQAATDKTVAPIKPTAKKDEPTSSANTSFDSTSVNTKVFYPQKNTDKDNK